MHLDSALGPGALHSRSVHSMRDNVVSPSQAPAERVAPVRVRAVTACTGIRMTASRARSGAHPRAIARLPRGVFALGAGSSARGRGAAGATSAGPDTTGSGSTAKTG